MREVYTWLQVPKSSKVEVTLDQGCATVWQTLVPTLLQHTWFTIRWNRKCKTIQSTPFYCNAAIWIQRVIIKKVNQRMYVLRKLNSFCVQKKILRTFILPLLRVSWVFPFYVGTHHSLLGTRIVLQTLVRTCSKMIGVPLRCLAEFYKQQMLRKTRSITGDDSHPLKFFLKYCPLEEDLEALNAHLIDINVPLFQRLFVFAIQSLKCIFFVFYFFMNLFMKHAGLCCYL